MSYLSVHSCLKYGALGLFMMAAMPASATAQALQPNAVIAAERAAAQDALAAGNRQEALRRIENVLRFKPSDLSARFFRAQLLVSMGRGDEIRDEIELLSRLRLPDSEVAKAEALLAKIDKDMKRLSGKITLRGEVGYADNVNTWPTNGEVTRGGLTYPLPDPIYQKFDAVSDRITAGKLILSGTYKLNEDQALKAHFGFVARVKHAPDTVSADQRYMSGSVGLEKGLNGGVVAKAGLSTSKLNRVNQSKDNNVNTDLATTGANIDLSKKLNRSVTVGYRYNLARRDHSKLPTADLSDSKTGTNRLYLGTPVGKTVYLRSSLQASKTRSNLKKDKTDAQHQSSRERVNKDTKGMSLLALVLLPRDQRIIGTASYNRVKYAEQVVDTDVKRRDNIRAITLGYSINGVQVWSKLDGLSLGLDATYSKTGSNQASAKITSKTYMFSVSKSFDL